MTERPVASGETKSQIVPSAKPRRRVVNRVATGGPRRFTGNVPRKWVAARGTCCESTPRSEHLPLADSHSLAASIPVSASRRLTVDAYDTGLIRVEGSGAQVRTSRSTHNRSRSGVFDRALVTECRPRMGDAFRGECLVQMTADVGAWREREIDSQRSEVAPRLSRANGRDDTSHGKPILRIVAGVALCEGRARFKSWRHSGAFDRAGRPSAD